MIKKASTPIAIVLLVLIAVVLVSYSLYAFITNKDKVDEKILVLNKLQEVYSQEDLINFYLSKGHSLQEAVSLSGGGEINKGVVSLNKRSEGIDVTYKFKPKV